MDFQPLLWWHKVTTDAKFTLQLTLYYKKIINKLVFVLDSRCQEEYTYLIWEIYQISLLIYSVQYISSSKNILKFRWRPSFIRHPRLFANLAYVLMLADNRGYTVLTAFYLSFRHSYSKCFCYIFLS